MHKTKSIPDFIPDIWFKDKDKSSVWLTAYRIFLADKKEFNVIRTYDLDCLRVVVFYGHVSYLDASLTRLNIDPNGKAEIHSDLKENKTPESGWLLILQPFVIDGLEQNEPLIRMKAGIYATLYAALNGRNMAFDREFDNIISLKDLSTSAHSPTFVNPNSYPIPSVTNKRLDIICEAGKRIEKKEEKERRRIELSLHWFGKGMRSSGVDSFVSYWIALETLCMPDTTKILPLEKSLAKAYNMTLKEVKDLFGVGRIFNLRGRILHGGENLPIHQLLSTYMENLFEDVLLVNLNMKTEHKAKSVIDRIDFDLNKLVHISS